MTDNAVLIQRAQAGEKQAREVLIEQNLGLVRHIVKRFLDGAMRLRICSRLE